MANRLWERIKWLRRSSMVRLSLLLSVIFALGFAIAIFVALTLGRDANERRVDASLTALASAAVLEESRGDSPAMILRATNDLGGLPDPFHRAVQRDGGTVQLRNDYLRSDIWRVLVAQDGAGTPIMLAVPLEDSEQAQELLAGIMWTTAAVVIGLTLAIGLVAGVLAQRRLARIDATLGQLASGNLTARTGQQNARDDLDQMARRLDNTAGELERLVTQTRNLSASIAHDLRTPLARLRAQLEMLPSGDEKGAALEEANRLSDIFDTIMRVARIEAAQGRQGFEPVAMDALAKDVAEIFGPVIEDEGKSLTLQISEPARVDADHQMLIQALANLIQNAIVHGGDTVTLIAEGTSIGVADNGPGVDPGQYEEITKPMVRLDSARSRDGSGLGLALVRAVAERHGAKLEMSPVAPHGLRITLNFANL